ncbi:OTU domain-containing protein 3 [Strongylocentrotus purpuratus]|uniref:OTU domain-containing protein 3 n=1 Tax=Strongylocentrotus purpuratus TaxID=7668 RepID=A0A7M7G0P6_STRPU|nr:OTU domain-containing protein 3 [Strongylocentrotus purpuratus]
MARSAAQNQERQGQRSAQQGGQSKPSKGQRQDAAERKRDERAIRNAYRKTKKDESYLADDQNFASFATQLQSMGLQLRDIPGDGNCLFRALGDQLEGHGRNHMAHRLDVVQYMRDHKDNFEPFMEDDVPFERHLVNLAKPGTYAGNDSIVAFARLLKVNVVIHQLNLPVWRIVGSDKPSCKELHISYHNGDHYSSVRKLGDNSEKATNFRNGGESSSSDIKPKPKARTKSKVSDEIDPPYTNGTVEEDGLIDVELHIMVETGCEDVQLIRETFMDNECNVDATIGVLLQVTNADCDTFSHDNNSIKSGERSPQGAAGIWSTDGSGTRLFGVPEDSDSSSSSKTQPNRTPGGKAKNQSTRQQKAQKRLEKKQRQAERHRQRIQGENCHSNTTTSSDEESSSVVLVGQMGALSI